MWAMPNVMAALPNIGGALCQRRNVWLTPNTGMPCSNAAKTQNPLKFAGVPQSPEPISAVSGPKFTILRGRIVDTCLNYEDIAGQSCAMVPTRQFFGDFCVLYFSEPRAAYFRHAF